MQVQNRRRHGGLRQHVVNLTAVMGLMIEEMGQQHRRSIVELPAFVIFVADRPVEKFRR